MRPAVRCWQYRLHSCDKLHCFIKHMVDVKACIKRRGLETRFPESLRGFDALSKIVVECPEIPRQLADLRNLKDIELHSVDGTAENELVSIAFCTLAICYNFADNGTLSGQTLLRKIYTFSFWKKFLSEREVCRHLIGGTLCCHGLQSVLNGKSRHLFARVPCTQHVFVCVCTANKTHQSICLFWVIHWV